MTTPPLPDTETSLAASQHLDTLATAEALALMHTADEQAVTAVGQANHQLAPVITAATQAIRQGGRLLYFGAGTSGRLAVLDASEIPPTFSAPPHWVQGIIAGGDIALRHAVEGAEDDPTLAQTDVAALALTPNDVVVGISASGGAPYVLEVIRLAQTVPVLLTVGMTSVANSPLATLAQQPVVLATGAEVLTGSTRLKAGTAQKLALNRISTLTMVALGKTYGHHMVDVAPTNVKLRHRATRLVQTLAPCESPQQAQAWLDEAKGSVKLAIVMARTGLPYPQAEALLTRHNGHLRQALEAPPPNG
jgi:N-acetylmuramic acid 6-phosphate etherase